MSGVFQAGQPARCLEAEEQMMLRLYGELPADEAAALDQHLSGCEHCRREMASLRALEETLAEVRPAEPSAGLLAQTRLRLRGALDAEVERSARRSWLGRALFVPAGMLRGAPFAAAAMLLMGAGLGGFGGYQLALKSHAGPALSAPTSLVEANNAPIASVSSVSPNADGKGITVRYNRLVPQSYTGATNDPFIRNVLAAGVQSPTDPSVQDDSMRLLAETCSKEAPCEDSRLRGALMTAARYDGDAAMRSEALHSLEPYVAVDPRVRDAVLESLMRDASPQVRTRAIQMLSPVEADSSVRSVLHNVSTNDQDPQIRTQSREALDVGLQIQ